MPEDPFLKLDRERSAERIRSDIELLATSPYTASAEAICRYAYTPEYERTLDFFRSELAELGFHCDVDPVGTLFARNRPPGVPVFGIGSHCDSNRTGGKYDGTLGVVVALEVCRLNSELEIGLPLQLIAFLEEEGSGFGQVLLGSRIMAGRMSDREMAAITAIDDGRSFVEHAREAGHSPERWRESAQALDDLIGWIEPHIEQGRVLQDRGKRLGVVPAIAGYIHADLLIAGRADHAGATPMDLRADAGLVAAEVALEAERLAIEHGGGTVATVGEIEFEPGQINVIPGKARISLDIRGINDDAVIATANETAEFAASVAARRGATVEYRQRQRMPATPMDDNIVAALKWAAQETGEPFATIPSGAAHDTMCVADHHPTAMIFIPCLDGISHSPAERAEPADAAVATEVALNAIRRLCDRRGT